MKQTMIWKDEAVGAAKLAALGHPVRWAMVRELAREAWAVIEATKAVIGEVPGTMQPGPETVPVSEMAGRLGMGRAAVANHLPQMLAAGAVAVSGDPGGDGRKRCLGLPQSAMVRTTEAGLEVDFGDVVVRFPKA